MGSSERQAEVSSETVGSVDGNPVTRYSLENSTGMIVQILTYGGILQSIQVPDRAGNLANVALGFATLDDYLTKNRYFGCITGRFANRIANGRFTLDGKDYQLATNNGPNALHGGLKGFDKQIWSAASTRSGGPDVSLALSHRSPDGEEGYPGTLDVTVTYVLTAGNELQIHYSATTDAPTIVNLTNHCYFNLAGEGSGDIYRHRIRLNASGYLPTDETSIPLGEIAPVAGTPFDFRESTEIGARIRDGHEQIVAGRGYDHNYVLDRPSPDDGSLDLVARVEEPTSGRVMEVFTTEPGVQFYTGNYLDGAVAGAGGRTYRQGDGLALETQHFPDSPNRPEYPSTVIRPGQPFASTTAYAFSTI